MKKGIAVFFICMMVFGITSCDNKQDTQNDIYTNTEGTSTFEIAMITDAGTIDDKSFNQGVWEGIKVFGDENGITYRYFKPNGQNIDAYLHSIRQAVEAGAKVVVAPGYLFQVPIFAAQELYPDVCFVLVDAVPADEDGNTHIAGNTVGILFDEDQSGYLAGYAAVREGYTKLGFMGGMDVPAVIRYGYGFAQGADAAAKDMGIENVSLNYHYTGSFLDNPKTEALASSWYENGTEVIFGCGGTMGLSVIAAAESCGAKVIGVDVDQSGESQTIITSAMKEIAGAVQETLKQYYNGEFPGGQAMLLGASKHGIGLPMETSQFQHFTKEEYLTVYETLASGAITLKTDQDAKNITDLVFSNVKITFVEKPMTQE